MMPPFRRLASSNALRLALPSMRERIRSHLDLHRARLRAPAGFHQPRRAVTVRAPQSAAFPSGVWIVDAPVESLGEEADRVRDAQRDHLAVLERDEAVVQVARRDRYVLAEAGR